MAATTPNGSAISMTLPSSMPADDADRLHRPDELVDLLGREQVLLDLVGDDAVAGLLDRQARERLRLRRGGCGHRVDDGVDLFLRELGELRLGLLARGARACAPRGWRRGRDPTAAAAGAAIVRGSGGVRSALCVGAVLELREDPLDFGVRPGDDVHGDELADAPRGGGAGVGRGFDGADSPRTITVT